MLDEELVVVVTEVLEAALEDMLEDVLEVMLVDMLEDVLEVVLDIAIDVDVDELVLIPAEEELDELPPPTRIAPTCELVPGWKIMSTTLYFK